MLPLAADLLADLRMVTRASPRVTLRASSLLCLSRLWPAKAVEAHAVAVAMAAMVENRNPTATGKLKTLRSLPLLQSVLRCGCSYSVWRTVKLKRTLNIRLEEELGPQSALRSVIGCAVSREI